MKHLILPVKRPFNAGTYLILLGLIVPAVFAIWPYLLATTATAYPGFWNLLLGAGIDLLLYAALGAAGSWFASRIGLGMPLIEGWTKRQPSWDRLPGIAGISILAGILLVLVKALDVAVASLLMQPESSIASAIVVPVWQGFLAAFSAGITEETMFRLFGLTLLTWLGSLLFRSQTGRPAPGLLWTANILFAILFGLGHLLTMVQMDIRLDALTVIRTLILNGVGGVVFGWLYVAFGLESAMLAHISADVIKLGLVPLVTQQRDPTQSIIVGAAVGLVVAVTSLWSIRAILRDRRLFRPSANSGSQQTERSPSHLAA